MTANLGVTASLDNFWMMVDDITNFAANNSDNSKT